MTTIKNSGFEPVKAAFYGKASNILVYKTDKKRRMPTDPDTIEKYKNEVVERIVLMQWPIWQIRFSMN